MAKAETRTVAPALKALVEGLVDYAGLFPPASKSLDEALVSAREAAETSAEARAKAAGAVGELLVRLSETIDEVTVGPENYLFLQAIITAEANAR